MTEKLPRVRLLTCGGTIVSSGESASQMTGYRLKDFSVDALLAAVPGLADVARIDVHEVARIDSMSMTSAVWKDLGRAIAEADADPDIDGIVVTHGTDTMEETAWFTHLTMKTAKPVVFTGAMRPSTALSADGPLNLYNAVRIAVDPEARGRGVLVALNDVIYGARAAMKVNPTNAAAFGGLAEGPLGIISGDAVVWLGRPEKPFGAGTPFKLETYSHPRRLPRVDILYSHADDDGMLVRAAVEAGAEAIVHAGTGNGSIHAETEKALAEAAERGVFIIRASRVPGGCVTPGLAEWQERGYIPSGTLSPQKARILAMLALVTFGWNPEKMKEAFERF